MLKQWGKWFDNQLDKFSMWAIIHGRRGELVFELAYFGFMAVCILFVAFPMYIGFTLLGMPAHLALIVVPVACFVFFSGLVIHAHLNPSKVIRRQCARCGMPAVLFCWKGPCAPGTWHCAYHFIQLHFPPEERSAIMQRLSNLD